MLIAQGIDAVLLGEYQQGGVGELMPSDFSSIHVPEDQVSAAKILIQEYQQASPTKPVGSHSHNRIFIILMALLILFVSISIFFKLLFDV